MGLVSWGFLGGILLSVGLGPRRREEMCKEWGLGSERRVKKKKRCYLTG